MMCLYNETITKEEINLLPLRRFSGNIHLLNSNDDLSHIYALKNEKIIGFDTETKPNYKKGNKNSVAVIQFSTLSDAYILRIINKTLPNEIIDIFSCAECLKVGVALGDDIKDLKKIVDFEHKGFVDLAKIAKELKIVNTGLRSLAAIFLGIRISKQAKLTNWESKNLTAAQINYAATDAWVGKKIADYIELNKIKSLAENI